VTDAEYGVETVQEEMRLTLESQVERLREIDSKAIEILKANLLLIGIFATGISVLVQTGIDIGVFVNLFTLFAGLLLLVSTALAGITYTSSNIRGGIDGQALERSRDADYTPEDFEDALSESYGYWIEYNAEVTAVNDILITVTVLLVVDAFVYLVAGIALAVLGVPFAVSAVLFVVLTVVVGWLTRLVYHMDHINSRTERTPPFRGVRVSKGTSRRRGFSALVRMLRSTEEEEPEE